VRDGQKLSLQYLYFGLFVSYCNKRGSFSMTAFVLIFHMVSTTIEALIVPRDILFCSPLIEVTGLCFKL
jgi:hypothetical protein